ncbi:peptidase M50 family protein isoform X2 [Tasmannia lanceolata]|uniref:peptidase M50 family protein isoform X2 n=1 Tax=Tasmannia lanceolata TaxID=3420 RepID=UPI00406422DD
MAGHRARRTGRPQTLLPLRTRHLFHTLSCWYCDFKISAFNDLLFSIGRKHARFLRLWFALGVGFSFMALIGATLILLWEAAGALRLYNGTIVNWNFPTGMLFGLFPMVPGLRISIIDIGYMIISTLVSIAIHEFGHAVAAASEGIHIEYIAIFLAILFPGALVAFNYELLQSLPQFTVLRIYCAGIWHNAVCCAVCGLALFLLPLILYPLYVHSENPMVLSVAPTSTLSGYLSHGDIILSLDGSPIHDPQEWTRKMVLMDGHTLKESGNPKDSQGLSAVSGEKGYCIPSSWVEESMKVQPVLEPFACPDELTAFKSGPCFKSSSLENNSNNFSQQNITSSTHCLHAKDVVKLQKCGSGWQTTRTNHSSCPCSQDEFCLAPVQMPGLTWVEIAYSRPYSSECLQLGQNSLDDFENPNSGLTKCGGTFVFVGDVLSVVHSIQLTSYRPRWAFSFGPLFPNMLEKILAYISHVSATLALLNSLPVFFLDGESILETSLCHIPGLSPRRRSQVLRLCLLSGSFLSFLAFSRILLSLIVNVRTCGLPTHHHSYKVTTWNDEHLHCVFAQFLK